jgi:hypothetical protein
VPKRQKKSEYFAKIGEHVAKSRGDNVVSSYADARTHPAPGTDKKVLEAGVLRNVLTAAKNCGILLHRNNVGAGCLGPSGYRQYGIKDAGDLIGTMPDGRYIEVECKRGSGGIWSAGQQKHAAEVEKKNGLYCLVHSAQEFLDFTRPHLKSDPLFESKTND